MPACRSWSATAASCPSDTDVANALGAVVGQVRVSAEALVSQPSEGLFRVSAGETVRDFTDEAAAIAAAEADVRATAGERALAAGTDTAEIEIVDEFRASTVEGQRSFIEAQSSRLPPGGRGLRCSRRRAICPGRAGRCPAGQSGSAVPQVDRRIAFALQIDRWTQVSRRRSSPLVRMPGIGPTSG